MKTTELKLGDWVMYNSEPFRIAESNLFVCSAWDRDEDIHHDIYYENLSPIPLTSDILEKNGWVRKKYHKGFFKGNLFMFSCGSLGFYVYSWHKIKDTKHYGEDVEVIDGVQLTTIRYVHQLQHLLWALGIDDDLKI